MSAPANDSRELLARSLVELRTLRKQLELADKTPREPIAVVGIGCRFPPEIRSPEAFWRFLQAGGDASSEPPPGRWAAESGPEPEGLYVRRGAFLRSVDGFDARFFGITERELRSLDPQQRLLLEVSWEALEHAGIAADRLRNSRTGVFVGISASDYAHLLTAQTPLSEVDGYFGPGTALSFAAGRISYFLGLCGPSMAIDTACSSSLVAVHEACQSLRLKETDVALAGGVSLMLSRLGHLVLCKARVLSPSGRCKTFDADADGYARGEGCGVVVLRRLGDALRDGNRVLAVIRGSAVNQDGPSSGLTVPNAAAQEALIREAVAAAGISPHELSYVEAHGTGTPLGDPIEARALAAALTAGRPAGKPLFVGTVKTNIGHLEAAAGIAGLIKLVLCLGHRELPRHLHLRRKNPSIDWEKLGLEVVRESMPWPAGPPLAGVSSFGASGTNAHVVLEAPPALSPAKVAAVAAPRSELLLLSAKSEKALRALCESHAQALTENPGVPLADWCYTAAIGRARLPHAVALCTDDPMKLQALLALLASGQEDKIGAGAGVALGSRPLVEPRVAFLFGDEDASAPLAGQTLLREFAVYADAFKSCDRLLQPLLGRSLLGLLLGEEKDPAFLQQHPVRAALHFARQWALSSLFRSLGIEPSAVLGQGVGEHVAACASGSRRLEEVLPLVVQEAGVSPPRPQPEMPLEDRLRALRSSGHTLLVELGPGAVLSDRVCQYIGDAAILLALHPIKPERETLLRCLGELLVRGVQVQLHKVHADEPRRRISLPTYPFQRTRSWLGKTPLSLPETAPALLTPTPTPAPAPAPGLVGQRLHGTDGAAGVIFLQELAAEMLPVLRDHRVYDRIVVSGSVHTAMAIQAMRAAFGDEGPYRIEALQFLAPLVLPEVGTLKVRMQLLPEGAAARFSLAAESMEGVWTTCTTGRLEALREPPAPVAAVDLAAIKARCLQAVDGRDFYTRYWRQDEHSLGASFRTIEELFRRDGEALARLQPLAPQSAGPLDPEQLREICLGEVYGQLLMPAVPSFEKVVTELGYTFLGQGIERVVPYARSIAKAAYAHAVLHRFSEQEFCGDVALLDEQGGVLVALHGLTARRVPRSLLKHAVARSEPGRLAPARPVLRGGSPESRVAQLRTYLLAQLAQLIGGEPDFDPETSLLELGIDSLMAIDLTEALRRDLNLKLEPGGDIQSQSVSALALRLAGLLADAPEPEAKVTASGPWLRPVGPVNPRARITLLCFPHAGAGPGAYLPLAGGLPAHVQIEAIQLPGRLDRLHETPLHQMPVLIDALLAGILPRMRTPSIFFGVSMGALVAFELVRALRRVAAPLPLQLIVAGYPAPELGLPALAADTALIEALATFGPSTGALLQARGLMPEPLASSDALRLFIPALRADLELVRDYRYASEAPLPIPITAMLGEQDPNLGREQVLPWSRHTERDFSFRRMPGGHLFYRTHKQATLRALAEIVRTLDPAEE